MKRGDSGVTIAELIFDGGVGVAVILSLIQIAPIKVNPWSAIIKAIGKPFTSEITARLDKIEAAQNEMKQTLESHIRDDGEHNADTSRSRILQFNTELMRGLMHSEEDFIEILAEIDKYEKYCNEHPEYPNKRAIHAVDNIDRVYEERLEKNDFL